MTEISECVGGGKEIKARLSSLVGQRLAPQNILGVTDRLGLKLRLCSQEGGVLGCSACLRVRV